MTSITDKYLTVSADETSKRLRDRLISGTTTYFVRFGDSELKMLSNPGHTSKTQANHPKLAKELREFIKVEDPRVMLAPGCGLDMRGYYEKLRHPPELDFRKNLAKYRPIKMFDNCHALTIKFIYDSKWFLEFCNQMRKRNVLFIGGKTLATNKHVQNVFGFNGYVKLPDKQAYKKLDDQMPAINRLLQDHKVVICVAGAAGKALAGRLYKDGWDGYFLDPGSLVNAISAPINELDKIRMSRGWMQKLVTPKLRRLYCEHKHQD